MTKKPKTYTTPLSPDDQAAEPAITYGEINLLKEQLIDCITQFNNPEILQRVKKYVYRQKKIEVEETISNEEILSGIEEGLEELKSIREGKKKARGWEELYNEL